MTTNDRILPPVYFETETERERGVTVERRPDYLIMKTGRKQCLKCKWFTDELFSITTYRTLQEHTAEHKLW